MGLLDILALICLGIGFVKRIVRLQSLRSKTHPQAEIAWKQFPLSAWRYETLSMVAITMHSLGLICLNAFLLISLTRDNEFTLLPSSVSVPLFAVAVLILTTHMSGGLIAHNFMLFAQQWIKPVSYGICANGMLYGGSLISWKSYSHHEVGRDDGLISLYSSYSPPLRTCVIKPPPEFFRSVLGVIQKNLPSAQPTGDSLSWHRSPPTLILAMALLALGAPLPAVWVWIEDQSWVWIYVSLAFSFVLILGNQLLTVFDGRGKYPAKRVNEHRAV
jgi:hypothetical protein